MQEGLGDAFPGTSNCLIAKNRDLEAIGTNAHELPMVYSALAGSDAALAQAPYDVLSDWHEEHDGNLRIILPDTYGTQGFLDNAPDWLAGWTGIRVDSGGKAGDLLGRPRCGQNRRLAYEIPIPHARLVRLGHNAHERF